MSKKMFLENYLKEIKSTFKIGIPILLSILSFVGMEFIDSVMAGHYSAVDLAGLAVAVSFLISIKFPLNGFFVAITPVMANNHGANDIKGIVENFRQVLVMGLGLVIVTILFMLGACYIFNFLNLEPEVLEVAKGYVLISLLGVPAYYFFGAQVALAEGMSNTKITMIISMFALALNAMLNYLFIYGNPTLSIEAMGAKGCAVATVLSQYFLAVVQWVIFKKMNYFKEVLDKVHLSALSIDFEKQKYYIKIGLPIFISLFFEVFFFTYAGILVTKLGTIAIAANQIFYNLMTVVFIIPFSISHVVSIRVGYSIGANNIASVKSSIIVCLVLGMILAITIATLLYIFKEPIAKIYTTDPEVMALVVSSAWVITLYQIGDYGQCIGVGVLRGLLKNKFLIVGSSLYWLFGAPLAYILGFVYVFENISGFAGIWFSLCLTLNLLGILYLSKSYFSYKELLLGKSDFKHH
ncbi:MAG: MATE family efflux transporter [Succinivibrionaceae bacterium]